MLPYLFCCVVFQAEVSVECLEHQREELRVLLAVGSLKGALQAYLANQKDPQAAWLFRFCRDVEELEGCQSEAPLHVFSKVVKVSILQAFACISRAYFTGNIQFHHPCTRSS